MKKNNEIENKIEKYIIANDVKNLVKIFKENPKDINLNKSFDGIGRPLSLAFHKSSLEIIELLVMNGANFLDVDEKDGIEIFEKVILFNRIDIIRYFNINFWIDYFEQTISLCASQKNTNFLSEVLSFYKEEREKNPNSTSELNFNSVSLRQLNVLFFYSALRNEEKNQKIFYEMGADLNFQLNNVTIPSVLKRNLYFNSYVYFSKIKNLTIQKEINYEDDENFVESEFLRRLDESFDIDEISYNIAKYGKSILEIKNEKGERVIEIMLKKTKISFFVRMFEILNDRSKENILILLELAKKTKNDKLIEFLIEESVK